MVKGDAFTPWCEPFSFLSEGEGISLESREIPSRPLLRLPPTKGFVFPRFFFILAQEVPTCTDSVVNFSWGGSCLSPP